VREYDPERFGPGVAREPVLFFFHRTREIRRCSSVRFVRLSKIEAVPIVGTEHFELPQYNTQA
jgi:hypothetical protein